MRADITWCQLLRRTVRQWFARRRLARAVDVQRLRHDLSEAQRQQHDLLREIGEIRRRFSGVNWTAIESFRRELSKVAEIMERVAKESADAREQIARKTGELAAAQREADYETRLRLAAIEAHLDALTEFVDDLRVETVGLGYATRNDDGDTPSPEINLGVRFGFNRAHRIAELRRLVAERGLGELDTPGGAGLG